MASEDSMFAKAVAPDEAPRSCSSGVGGVGAEMTVMEDAGAGCGADGSSEASMGERESGGWSTSTSPRPGTAVGAAGAGIGRRLRAKG